MRELELKFSLPLSLQQTLEREEGADADARRERVWSRYYDTPDGALANARMAVRVRRHGERWLQTVKADTGDQFERFEWERPIAGPAPEREALPPEDLPQGAVAHRSFGSWRPLFETDFERRSRRLTPAPGLVIELAQDVGEVRCGERRESIREVELECLEGTRAAFFDWALAWAGQEQACLLMPTKNERGLRLAARLPLAPAAVKAATVAPAPDLPPGEAAAAVLGGCLAHACANIEPILASSAVEGPHQFRVALRRLRTALRFFDLRDRDPAWAEIDRTASALADAAGRVRDVDVFESGLLRAMRARFPGDAALETLSRALTDAREAARMDLRRLLSGPGTTRFVLQVLAMSERLAHPGEAPALPGQDFAAFAATRLDAMHARVRRRATRARNEADWHRARIAVKYLRYAVEFGTAALPRRVDAARIASLLADWQDRLGAGQDLAAARDVAADALARPGVPPEAAIRATALIDGWRAFGGSSHPSPERDARRVLKALREAFDAKRSTRGRGAGRTDPPRGEAKRPSVEEDEPGARANAADVDAGNAGSRHSDAGPATEVPDTAVHATDTPVNDVEPTDTPTTEARATDGTPGDGTPGDGTPGDPEHRQAERTDAAPVQRGGRRKSPSA
jgi:triphosphatase